jgi:hypothetical protein
LDRFAICPPGPAEVIDSDTTTLTAGADKVINVGGPEPYLVNIELQPSHVTDLVETTWFRQVALYHRHRLPVLTVLVPLCRETNSLSSDLLIYGILLRSQVRRFGHTGDRVDES